MSWYKVRALWLISRVLWLCSGFLLLASLVAYACGVDEQRTAEDPPSITCGEEACSAQWIDGRVLRCNDIECICWDAMSITPCGGSGATVGAVLSAWKDGCCR